MDDAKKHYAEAEQAVEEYGMAADLCSYIQARADMFTAVLNKQNEMFVPLVRNMERIIQQKGTAYNTYDRYKQQSVAAAVSMVTGIKAVLDVKILNEDGELTTESKELAISMAEQLKLPYNEYELGDSDSYSSSSDYDYSDSDSSSDTYYITDDCIACGTCIDECPEKAISEGDVFYINPNYCVGCGTCADVCPNEAIILG